MTLSKILLIYLKIIYKTICNLLVVQEAPDISDFYRN